MTYKLGPTSAEVGVIGSSSKRDGMQGQSSGKGKAGVRGMSGRRIAAVRTGSQSMSYGVFGEHRGSADGVGVGGESASGDGVYGTTSSSARSGVRGVNIATGRGGRLYTVIANTAMASLG
jgi:hypothetical protein